MLQLSSEHHGLHSWLVYHRYPKKGKTGIHPSWKSNAWKRMLLDHSFSTVHKCWAFLPFAPFAVAHITQSATEMSGLTRRERLLNPPASELNCRSNQVSSSFDSKTLNFFIRLWWYVMMVLNAQAHKRQKLPPGSREDHICTWDWVACSIILLLPIYCSFFCPFAKIQNLCIA